MVSQEVKPRNLTEEERVMARLAQRPGALDVWRDKSMHAMRQARAAQEGRVKDAERQVQLMGRLVRLVDYVVAETVADTARSTSEAFTDTLVRTRGLLLVEGRCAVSESEVRDHAEDEGLAELKRLRKQLVGGGGGAEEAREKRVDSVELSLKPDAAELLGTAEGMVMEIKLRLGQVRARTNSHGAQGATTTAWTGKVTSS